MKINNNFNHNLLVFRNIQKADINFCPKKMYEWRFRNLFSPKVGIALAKRSFIRYWNENSRDLICEYNGEAVGFIMFKSKKEHANKKIKLPLSVFLNILFSNELFKARWYIKSMKQTIFPFKKTHGEKFESEIILFFVDEKARGLGVGKSLFEKAVQSLRETGAKSYFLLTDCRSNYYFYEKNGMERIGEISDNFFAKNKPHQFYIYSKNI